MIENIIYHGDPSWMSQPANPLVNHIVRVRQVRKRMIGLSVSMRCAGPGSWIKVVHLPVRTRLSVPRDPMSLTGPCLSWNTRTVRPSERVWERGPSLRRSVPLPVENGDIIPDDAAESERRSVFPLTRPERLFRKRSSRNWRLLAAAGCRYCGK